jgi:hypothetical protein
VLAAVVALASSCGNEGAIQDPPAAASPAETLSLEDARWAGRWQFNYALVKLEGIEENETNFTLGSKIGRVWDVTPGCSQGPCNAEIVATDPDRPDLPATKSVITYDRGSYRITQTFPPEPQHGCTSQSGRVIPGAFEATNAVEVKPTKFEETSGNALVTELFAVKTTTFRPSGRATDAGGTCVTKTAVWEGRVTPV